MKYIFSPDKKFKTWRKLWVALAEGQSYLGADITQAQINELKVYAEKINYEVAEKFENQTRHDVLAHILAYASQCHTAKKIIHLGATSCYVTDNTDIIVMREGLKLVKIHLLAVITALTEFARKYKGLPTLGFTHFQPAQLTTVGKRATLWIWELLTDLNELEDIIQNMRLLGSKGATGTQASFLELFNGDYDKVKKLDALIAEKMDFEGVYPVSGQTYSRKLDYKILSVLSGIAQSAHKFATDIRLLQHLKEVEEPFEESQVGSSAMAYKRNPVRCERICSLARYVILNANNPAITAAIQWFERTLDDSANKRITVPETFLATDGILRIYINVARALIVHPKMINARIVEELPFMITESIIMLAVKKGGDRQRVHERIRRHSMQVAEAIKIDGKTNDLLKRIAEDAEIGVKLGEIEALLKAENYTGCAERQTEEFIKNYVEPLLNKHVGLKSINSELKF